MNDQFGGVDAWEKYLKALEEASPPIRALGITDYYSTESYERVCEAKKNGRLPDCELIFPNIEMRFSVGTVKGRWVNLHLLVSPEQVDHIVELKRFLARLTFKAHGDSYCCNKEDLVRLGNKCEPKITDPMKALECGSQQFKVSFEELRQLFKESTWAQQNIQIAVAGSETDGASGIREASDSTLRQEIEKFAHVIFASSVAQRDFWLGRLAASPADLQFKYNGLKPCMHGSDAHEVRTVGLPDGDRFSWIKGALEFDALRQACIDPAGRAFVGTTAPVAAASSQILASIAIEGAPWARTPRLALNSGLVAIIGARGSGKTALADMIALGCDAMPEPFNPASFLTRARDLLDGASVTVRWQANDTSTRSLDGSDTSSSSEYPRARYLSQQFVEELCSAHGMTDVLMSEIERVIFEAHAVADRDGAADFDELLEFRASRYREARRREEETLTNLSERIGAEIEKQTSVPVLTKQVAEKMKLIAGYVADRAKLVVKGSETRVARLGALTAAAEKVRSYIRCFAAQEQALLALQDEVGDLRTNQAPEVLRQSQEKHKASQLKPEEWEAFLLDYKGDVDVSLADHLAAARKKAKDWRGTPPPPPTDPNAPFIADDTPIDNLPLATLQAEIARLEKLVSVDQEITKKFSALSKRLIDEGVALERLKEKLVDYEGAKARAKILVQERESAYSRVFDAIEAEQSVLTDLYSPLMARLDKAGGTLKKLAFSVERCADLDQWAEAGEHLLDLRQKGPFKGRGSLRQMGEETLKEPWESGQSAEVGAAMAKFRDENQEALLDNSLVPKNDQTNYRIWSKKFAKWLYGTDHVTIQYSIDYDGVDIRKLSPGTRGIVLLLLYLALDDADDRPLIIDQPEENLDPQSIFDELVQLFLAAKDKRQVIMVTHNANLVVNTDTDQVIVAQAGPHGPGELPPITYLSGGLETAHIRKAVCDILEGGERAFQERARRLRVRLER